MNDMPANSDARHKAVLAAVLAVQRGYLAPDEAVRVLAELPHDQPMQTLLNVAPSSAQAEIAAEVESIAADPAKVASTLAGLGMEPNEQSTLFSLKPDTPSAAATRALTSVAEREQRVRDKTTRLQSSSGRYAIKREFARGGMGAIYLAMDTAVGREVALKELLATGGGSTGGTSHSELTERFLREAKITGQLEHPNIVPVYEIATRDDGRVFYTMKLVRGKTLAHRLLAIQGNAELSEQQKLSERLALLDAFNDVCNAIAYAHSRGVIHRDIKPANIMLGDFGETLVLDWGLARVQGQEESSTVQRKADQQAFSPSLIADDSVNRTLDGAVLGTPAYMPPEQARGELDKVDERADAYALGAILYELLSGKPPYEGRTARDVLAKVLVLEPEPLNKLAPLAPPDLISLAEKCMAREADQRLESAAALGREVMAFRDGRNLSVYRYSSRELLRRFVKRNAAAVAIATIAVTLLITGGVYGFVNIASQRDQAQSALASADSERRAREELEEKQAAERGQLIESRRDEISAQRARLRDARPGNLAHEANARITELEQRGGVLSPADRTENARIVAGLLQASAAAETLIRLLTEPIAGRSHEFVSAADLEVERERLRDTRLLAAHLALVNDDFALASYIVEGTEADAAMLDIWRSRVEAGRGALLLRQREVILAALDDIRAGLARPGRPAGNIRLEDYVLQLSALRETQTVELMSNVLQPATEKARVKDPDMLWTQPERDAITLACRVLGYVELPERAVPLLAAFAAEIDDTRLAVEAGSALCQCSHALAYHPLTEMRRRLGSSSYAWAQISRWTSRVPEPPGVEQVNEPAALIELANFRYEQARFPEAKSAAARALELDPDSAEALYTLAAAIRFRRDVVELLEAAVVKHPRHAKLRALYGYHLARTGKHEHGLAELQAAIDIDPNEFLAFHYRGFVRNVWTRDFEGAIEDFTTGMRLRPHSSGMYANRAAAYLELNRHELAIGDATRAIELDPYLPEAWNNRATARRKVNDIEGAIDDLTRMLEVSPGHPWAYQNRGDARMELGQYQGAIADFTLAILASPFYMNPLYRIRGRCYQLLGEYDLARNDYEFFLQLFPFDRASIEVTLWLAELE